MLEPYAVKVASTVLRRELHREMGFLSDKDEKVAKNKIKKEQDFHKQEDIKRQKEIEQNLKTKKLVSQWIIDNPIEYKKLLGKFS